MGLRAMGAEKRRYRRLETNLEANTTEHLIADIEALREHLGIDKWLVWGGSWGSTLALAYAQRFPERVSEAVLVAVTNTREQEVDWLYGGVARYFPEAWEQYRTFVGVGPDASGSEVVIAYDKLLQGPDPAAREHAAIEWCRWEEAVAAPDAQRKPGGYLFETDPRKRMAFARLCAHYFSHHGFLPDGDLLRHADRLHGIPGALIHGRLDLTSPLVTAYRMHQAWPEAQFLPIDGAGHSSGPGMGETIGDVLDGFAADRPLL